MSKISNKINKEQSFNILKPKNILIEADNNFKNSKIEDYKSQSISNRKSNRVFFVNSSNNTEQSLFSMLNNKNSDAKTGNLNKLFKKFKKNDNEMYISKTKRINKYNDNDLVTSKELMIDTRNITTYSNYIGKNNNESNKRKFDFVKFRRNKYVDHEKYNKLNFIKHKNNDVEKELNNEINSLLNNYYENTPNKSSKNNNLFNSYQNSFFRDKNNKFSNTKCSISDSLYSILSKRKTQFLDVFKYCQEREKEKLKKKDQIKFLKNYYANQCNEKARTNYLNKDSKNMYNIKDEDNIYFSFMSNIKDDQNNNISYTLSEKERFGKIMEVLNLYKRKIKENPKQEFEITKKLLLDNNLYNPEYFDIEKLNNIIVFIKGKYIIDPKKGIQDNLLDIMYGRLKLPKIDKNKKENIQIKKDTFFNEKSNTISSNNEMSNDKLFYQNELSTNLNKQKTLELKAYNSYDIINQPKFIVDTLENQFREKREEEQNHRMQIHKFFNIKKNSRLFDNKISNNLEAEQYEKLKKKHLLTEYICLLKAKNNYNLNLLRDKYDK